VPRRHGRVGQGKTLHIGAEQGKLHG
jgi:hypothetical protein